MRRFIIVLFLIIAFNVDAQESVTFQVEELSKPKELLDEKSPSDIFGAIISKRVDIKTYSLGFPLNVLAHSEFPNKLVNYDHHSLFDGMFNAYVNHRPFVISPDMIWLLISQGFSHHVNFNAEDLRGKLVDHEGKEELVVYVDGFLEDCDWESIVERFSTQISENTKGDISNVLECNFSTTTQIEKIASQITIMNSAKSYFEYIVSFDGCGIPNITLEGSTEDWEKLLKKTEYLSQYDLEWWTKEITPIIEKIIETTKGSIDKEFWMNMFKYHTLETYGKPEVVDGWIVKFFPYSKGGERNGLKELYGSNNLPDEIVKVPVVALDALTKEVYNIELWAGFIGLEQNRETFALRPKIGWLVHEIVPPEEVQIKQEVDKLFVEVKDGRIPEDIFKNGHIKNLVIGGAIDYLPDDINVRIDTLHVPMWSLFGGKLLPLLNKELPNTYINIYIDN